MLLPVPDRGWAREPVVPTREPPEWLTPAALFAAGSPNKILKNTCSQYRKSRGEATSSVNGPLPGNCANSHGLTGH
jgi:hypothetical protein